MSQSIEMHSDRNKNHNEKEEKEGIFKSGFLLRSAIKSPVLDSLVKETSDGDAKRSANKNSEIDELNRVNNELNKKNMGSMFRPGFLLDRRDRVQDSSAPPASGLKVGRFLVEDPSGKISKTKLQPSMGQPVSSGLQLKEDVTRGSRHELSASMNASLSKAVG
jgi:hypothetical protein